MQCKLFLFAAMLLFIQQSVAKCVDENRARVVAQRWAQGVLSRSATSGINLQLVWDGETTASRSAGAEPTFYVYANASGKGFVIVSGNTITKPIIGYSHEAAITTDDMPDAFREWMLEWRSQVRQALADGVTTTDEWERQWNDMAAEGNVMVELETATWAQSAPFNDLCPEYASGKHSVTGCVATAASIVMRYYRYPEKGTGTIPGYTKTKNDVTITIDPHALGHTYDWDNMPLKYTSGQYNTYQAKQVAQLLYDMGTALKMNYGSSSSASTSNIPGVLKTYMGYTNAGTYQNRSSFTDSKWHEKLKGELDAKRPVIYRGQNTETGGGHSFIIDGYTDANYFHLNWGWSGNSNGYFLVSALNPTSTRNYNGSQAAIFGLYAPTHVVDEHTMLHDTQMAYDKVSNIMTLTVPKQVMVALLDANGKAVKNGLSQTGNVVSINGAKLTHGATYKVTLTKSSQQEQFNLTW